MKRVFLGLLLVSIFGVLSLRVIYAACDEARWPGAGTCVDYNKVDCSYIILGCLKCCDKEKECKEECPAAPTPAPTPIYYPPAGCSSNISGFCPPHQPVNCPGTFFCCPNASYCEAGGVTPYLTLTPSPDCIETAVGCVNVKDPSVFVAWFLKFAIGIGGGIAFLLMLFGAFQIMTSQGDPERLKAGKELITSALMGLLMIIFSVFLLQLIGVQILQIPGFGK